MSTVISPAVDREAWLNERRSGIGASEAAVVLGLVPSRLRLFLDKTDQLEPEPQSDWQLIGLEMEPLIARWYERRTGRRIRLTQHFLRHPDHDWLLATLDAVTECGRVVEFKTANVFSPEGRGLGESGDASSVPDRWLVQVQQQLALARATGEAGGDEADLAVWMNNDLRVYPVRRSDALWRHAADAIEEFWHEHVMAGVPPDEVAPQDAAILAKVFRRDSGEILTLGDEAAGWARDYQEIGRQIRDLEQERDVRRARLLLALGNAAGAELPDGTRVERKVVTINRKAQEARVDEQVRLTVKQPNHERGIR